MRPFTLIICLCEVNKIPELAGQIYMNKAYDQMISDLPQIFDTDAHCPKLIIAIDEAHPLSEEQKDFRPAHLLCRAISAYSRHIQSTASVWVVFASTTSKVADFAAPEAVCAFYPKIYRLFFIFGCPTR